VLARRLEEKRGRRHGFEPVVAGQVNVDVDLVYGTHSVRDDGVRLDDGFATETRLAHDGRLPHAKVLVASLVSLSRCSPEASAGSKKRVRRGSAKPKIELCHCLETRVARVRSRVARCDRMVRLRSGYGLLVPCSLFRLRACDSRCRRLRPQGCCLEVGDSSHTACL
jgi:hypothetical protein